MINELARAIYDACRVLAVPIYIKDTIPDGMVESERIIIIPKSIEDGTRWYRGFVEVNYLVPDKGGEADYISMMEAENSLKVLKYGQGEVDGLQYRYRKYSVSYEKDESLKCHFVNYRLLTEIQKVI